MGDFPTALSWCSKMLCRKGFGFRLSGFVVAKNMFLDKNPSGFRPLWLDVVGSRLRTLRFSATG